MTSTEWKYYLIKEFSFSPHSYIFTTTIRKDAKDTSKRVLALDQTSFGLSKEYLDKGLDEPEVQAYFK